MRRIHSHLACSAVLIAFATILSGCGSSSSSSPPTPSAGTGKNSSKVHLVNSGYLTVGSDTSYPPMESRDPSSGNFVGADIDLANAIAKQMNLSGAKIVSAAFDSLIPSLEAKRFDVIMSSMSHTAERAKRVDFVDYMTGTEGILVSTTSPIHARNYLALCGKNVTVQRGTTELDGLTAANKHCPSPIHILSFTDDTAAFQAFSAGHADAYTSDLPVVTNYIHKYPGKYRMAGPGTSAGGNYGIAVAKGNTGVLKGVKEALSRVRASGQYDKILKKWGVSDAALK